MNLYNSPGVTIGALARRTGISTSTIRAWERRYGFPVPERLDSGHRRYSDEDVVAIRGALRERESGASLALALQRAQMARLGPRSSVFGALRHAIPDVAPVALSKRAMLMLSRAIEDEIAARAQHPILVGAFQQDKFWRASEQRWLGLTSTARAGIVLGGTRRRQRRGNLWQVRIDPNTPIAREWVVVCDSPTFAVCLAGVELPSNNADRRFEAIWTTEAIVVRDIARLAVDIAAHDDSSLRTIATTALRPPAQATYDSVRATTALTNRMVSYMDGHRRS